MWNQNQTMFSRGTNSTKNESFQQFLSELKLLEKVCGYRDPDEVVRDRVLIECHSQKVREKLIQEGSEWTLEQAIDIARTYKLAQAQLQTGMVGEDRKSRSRSIWIKP